MVQMIYCISTELSVSGLKEMSVNLMKKVLVIFCQDIICFSSKLMFHQLYFNKRNRLMHILKSVACIRSVNKCVFCHSPLTNLRADNWVVLSSDAVGSGRVELSIFTLTVRAEWFSWSTTVEGRLFECGSFSVSKHWCDAGSDADFGKKIILY